MNEYTQHHEDRRELESPIINIIGIVLGVILTIGVGYIISSMTAIRTQTSEIQTKVAIIETQLDSVGVDLYKGTDANRDLALRDQRIQSLVNTLVSISDHVELYSARIVEIERKLYSGVEIGAN